MATPKTDRSDAVKTAETAKGRKAPKDTEPKPEAAPTQTVEEIGGRDGPDPTRYGDYEKDGRCVDF